MRKTAMLISAAILFLAGAAVAQNVSTPNTPAAAASTAAGPTIQRIQPIELPTAQAGTQAPSGPANGQPVPEAACNADTQKFCAGRDAPERLQCLIENKATLTAACRAMIDSAARN